MKMSTHFLSQSTFVTVDDLVQLNSKKSSLLSGVLNAISSKFSSTFLRGDEPRISMKRDRQGNTYWHVYEPSSGNFAHLESEKEVRIWLEKRYSF